MITLILLWLLLLAALIIVGNARSDQACPLSLSYFVGLSLIHVPGLLAYLGRFHSPGLAEKTASGFQVTLIGMGAFVIAVILTSKFLKHRVALKEPSVSADGPSFELSGWTICAVGIFSNFVLVPLSFSVPSLSAPLSALGVLIVIGIWIELYRAKFTFSLSSTLGALGLAGLLPFTTILSSGFIGFGTYWALSVVCFYFSIADNRRWMILAAPFFIYVGLSIFVTYMDQRAAIRESIWQRQAPISERISQVSGLFTEFQWLDLDSRSHAGALDERLNQNRLVEAGVRRHRDGFTELAYGGTVPWWAPIPRALWPEKPVIGGGRDIVSRYTGIRFSPNTSVGVGQVLEFYINFGFPGVVFGFIGLGILLAWLDRKVMAALAQGNLRSLLLTAMPGLTLIQPGGNLLEIAVGLIAAIIISHLLIVALNNLGARTNNSAAIRNYSAGAAAADMQKYR